MPTEVQIPDGTTLEFPDGMSQADMAAAIYKNFPALRPRSKIPDTPSLEPIFTTDAPPIPVQPPAFKPTEAFTPEESLRVAAMPPLPKEAIDALKEGSLRSKGVGIIGEQPYVTPKVSPQELEAAFNMPKGSAEWVSALQHATTGLVDFFMTPEGASLGAIGGIKSITRPIAGAFAAQMAVDAPEQAIEAYKAFQAGDTYKAKQHAANALLATGMAGLAAKGAMAKGEVAVTPELARLAPETAKVMAEKEAPVEATKQPDPNWNVTVWHPERMPNGDLVGPEVVQIDIPLSEEAGHTKSTNPDALRAQGYDIPAFSEFSKLPHGQYKMADALKRLEPAPSEGEAALGIVPPGAGKLQEFIDKMIPRAPGTPTPINADVITPLPDFQTRAVAKKIGSEPFGIGRLPVLGPLLDPRARIRTGVDEAISTYHYERGVGQAIASALGEEIRGTIDPLFEIDKATGQIMNIGTRTTDQSLNISDVFEALQKNPESYILNPQQRAAFERIQGLFEEMRKLEDKYELFSDPNGEIIPGRPERKEQYFPRIVTERPPTDVAPKGGGARVGAKQFFEKERMFESEAEGVQHGYGYEPSIEKRITTRAERLYKAIADRRLAEDTDLGARTRKDVENELREAYAEELGSGEMSEHKLQQIVSSVERKGSVWDQPAFYNKIFSQETANRLREAFPIHESTFRKWIVGGNNLLKAMMLSADMGAPFIQGLVMMFRHPVLWGKAVGNSYKALFNKQVFPEYVRQNLGPIREMAQMGSTVGRLQEMLAGLETGQPLTKIPYGVGKAFEAFGRGFQSFLDVAKIEIWKATREVTPRNQWMARMQEIESELGIGRMESIGVGRKSALTERVFLLAPSYYRGAVNLIGAMISEKGVSGAQARKAMASYLVGGQALFIGLAKAIGMKDDEIKERLNPANANYLMWSVQTETGRKFNVGLGGIHRSLIRLMANTIKTSIQHPGDWAKLTSEENPLVRWYRGHAAPLPSIAMTGITGKDILGNEAGVKEIAGSTMPLAVQQLIQKPGQPKPSYLDVGLSFLGLTAYPEKLQEQFGREREALAQKLYQKPYENLGMAQQARVTREVSAKPEFKKEPATPRQEELARKSERDRLQRLGYGLSDKSKEKLKILELRLPNYQPEFTTQRTTVPMTKAQREKYETLVIEEYNKVIESLNVDGLKNRTVQQRQDILGKRLTDAKERARRRLFQAKAEPSP